MKRIARLVLAGLIFLAVNTSAQDKPRDEAAVFMAEMTKESDKLCDEFRKSHTAVSRTECWYIFTMGAMTGAQYELRSRR